MKQDVTLFRPGPGSSATGPGSSALPTDLLSQSASRLRILALLYAFVFFMAGVFPMLVVPNDRVLLFNTAIQWAPPLVAIARALAVAAVIGSHRLSLSRVMTLGLLFEVASSYGIAVAELIDARGYSPDAEPLMFGLSWVAPWIMLFTIVVPASPRRALTAALAAVSAVPVTQLLLMSQNLTRVRPDPGQFFFWLVLPYVLVVGMAYVGARVVYALGSEIKRARELGSYQLEEKLGQGGMGEVWRARHRLLARPAAIKLLRSNLAQGSPDRSSDLMRRFELEAQVIASLRSPHTVNLFDFGVAEDGSFYYAMELLEGLDTDRLVRRFGPLPAERVIFLMRQVCHSLAEAEARGLVHRDVKPANIFVCRYGEEFDFVKVLDFGIVKAIQDGPETARGANLTGDHAVNGTPAFMAPEQVLGGKVDGRTDIYAAGCVAYWLLTGQLVFDAPNPMGHLMQHTSAPPRRPSSRTELALPTALDDLVIACLAKNPADRPQSARDLSRLLGSIPGAEEWTAERARVWWERTGL